MNIKKIFLLSLAPVLLCVSFLVAHTVQAKASEMISGIQIDSVISITREKGKIHTAIKGKLTDAERADFDKSVGKWLGVRSMKITETDQPLGFAANWIWPNSYDSDHCDLDKSTNNFTCPLAHVSEYGTYVFQIGDQQGTDSLLFGSADWTPFMRGSSFDVVNSTSTSTGIYENITLTPTVVGGNSIKITGAFSAKTLGIINNGGAAPVIAWGKQKNLPEDTVRIANLSNELIINNGTAQYSIPTYTVNFTSGAFSATIQDLNKGVYVFAMKLSGDEWLSSFTEEAVSGDSNQNQYQLVTPVSTGGSSVDAKGLWADPQVKITNPDAGDYLLELGYAKPRDGSGTSYQCFLSPETTKDEPVVTVKADTASATIVNGNKFSFLQPGLYCLGMQFTSPALIPTQPGTTSQLKVDQRTEGGSSFATIFSVGGASIPQGATLDQSANGNGCVNTDNSTYCLLAPLPGIGDPTKGYSLDVTKGIGDYFNIIIRLVMGIIGVLSVLMIIIGGIEYMSTVKLGEKEGAKERIMNALFGLLLALTSYIILKTINPKLVDITVNIPSVSIAVDSIDRTTITSNDISKLTGKNVLTLSQYTDKAKQLSAQLGIPACGLLTTLVHESQGKVGAIGPDENVASAGVKSRRAFIASRQKYSGAALPAGATATNKSIVNDDTHALAGNTLHIDGRFSYGIGLLQVTVFPDGFNSGSYTTNPPDWASYKDRSLSRTIGSNQYSAVQLLDADTNLKAGAELWAEGYTQCGQNVEGVWRRYIGGTCSASSDYIDARVDERMATYNKCVADGSGN